MGRLSCFVVALVWLVFEFAFTTPLSNEWNNNIRKTRRNFLVDSATKSHAGLAASAAIASSSIPWMKPQVASSAATAEAARLAQRDPSLLRNSVFNIPPAAQLYPPFMRGRWNVTCRFSGYLFPSLKISRQRLIQDFDIPGFQKCSIAATCDVGKEMVAYEMKIDETTGLEDRRMTLTSQIQGFLGYPAVKEVIYNVRSNPNRISIDFYKYRTRNAERIELFCNARESEHVVIGTNDNPSNLFVHGEYIKQVTFGGGPDVGIARQVAGNYAHFWTWQQDSTDDHTLRGNLLTAAYLDPQDPLYFDEPSMPVAVYSHVLNANRIIAV